jgi:hypothetical protein
MVCEHAYSMSNQRLFSLVNGSLVTQVQEQDEEREQYDNNGFLTPLRMDLKLVIWFV